MHAMPVMIVVLCVMAIAYRYYSAFLAARVATLDDARATPAVRLEDGHNYHPTSKWVLFGHHFAAISGAGPLIGPVLAAQFGYLPGLMWIVIGVCLAGAVQDFLVLAASIRRNGKSLAQIAFADIGPVAGWAAMVGILFIVTIALAGLGKVVVNSLGGEIVKYPPGSVLVNPDRQLDVAPSTNPNAYYVSTGTEMFWNDGKSSMKFSDGFTIASKTGLRWENNRAVLPADAVRLVPGSSWGTFTIACTIPIALLVGFYMYRIRKGRVVEASILGGLLTLGATFLGGWVATSQLGPYFNLSAAQVTWAMAIYGFVASVLPVWLLLCPRDYLSSFLKIGTIALLVGGVLIANPKLEAPAINHVFINGGPTVTGKIFPFLFITIMCGAISGFHSLVSSGTTPKMIKRESHARTIGYGAMLVEGLVGVVAMIAAAALPVGDWAAMNTDLATVPRFHDRFVQIGADVDHLAVYEQRTQEALRGRTGGAVTLAVGIAHIFEGATTSIMHLSEQGLSRLWKYWYHFAIMFEALFILTTIDTGTRIGRFLLQEMMGKIHPKLGQADWWPGAMFSTAIIVCGWVYFLQSDDFAAIWAMFGVANQMLVVIALAVVSVYLVNEGRAKYLWVSVLPMIVVMTTTSTAAVQILLGKVEGIRLQWAKEALTAAERGLLRGSIITAALLAAMMGCTLIIIIAAGLRIAMARDRTELPAGSQGR